MHYKRFHKLVKQELENKRNHKGFVDSVSMANDEFNDIRLAQMFFQLPQVHILLQTLGFGVLLVHIIYVRIGSSSSYLNHVVRVQY